MSYDFETLCVSHYPELLSFALKRTSCKARAEDVVQEAMFRAWMAWSRWEPQGDPAQYARAWLYRIVSNTFTKQYHREKQADSITKAEHSRQLDNQRTFLARAELHQQDTVEHPGQSLDALGDEVEDALGRIRPEWADVVRLVYAEGVPAHEAAKVLKIAPGTVRSRMARGRLALARILAPLARQRFGYKVSAGADERHLPLVPAQELQSDADSIESVVAEDDDRLLGIA